jgi:hypothetical protein
MTKKYSMKFTAEKAREAFKPTAEDEISAIESDIELAATSGKRELILRSKFWVNEGYSKTPKYQEACNILRENGYTVEFFYEEHQFVDMYTIVKWDI